MRAGDSFLGRRRACVFRCFFLGGGRAARVFRFPALFRFRALLSLRDIAPPACSVPRCRPTRFLLGGGAAPFARPAFPLRRAGADPPARHTPRMSPRLRVCAPPPPLFFWGGGAQTLSHPSAPLPLESGRRCPIRFPLWGAIPPARPAPPHVPLPGAVPPRTSRSRRRPAPPWGRFAERCLALSSPKSLYNRNHHGQKGGYSLGFRTKNLSLKETRKMVLP